MLPWGGPAAQAKAPVKVDIIDILLPLIPSMIAGVLWILGVAFFLGRR